MSADAAAPVPGRSRTSPGARVATYVVLVLALSSALWIPLIRAGTLTAGGGALTFGLMWCPAAAA
ncbi:MAG TPA: hypothetical protein VH854_07830, partial [Thermoanaerobaculia bacterium]|nr:hypothetical protein [Thermoanaerobaculia bacterium]